MAKIETLNMAWSDVTPDTFRNCFRRTGSTTQHIQSALPEQDGAIGDLREELGHVPDAVPKGVTFEDFLSVNDDFPVTVSPSGTDSVTDVMAAGAAESTEETENVTRDIASLFGAFMKVNEEFSSADTLCQYYFHIEGHGLKLAQTTSPQNESENKNDCSFVK